MKKALKQLLQKTKNKKVGLFIDNANWFYPQKELGWDIDFKKIKNFLEKFFKVHFLKLYAGTPLDLIQKRRFLGFKKAINHFGYEVETKPLKKIWLDRRKGEFVYKCNFDVEIALDVARNIKKIDIVMLGSGDSDFIAVKDFALENNKGFVALCFEKGVSWEIRRGYHIFLEDIKTYIEEK